MFTYILYIRRMIVIYRVHLLSQCVNICPTWSLSDLTSNKQVTKVKRKTFLSNRGHPDFRGMHSWLFLAFPASPSHKQAPGFSRDIPGLHSWLFPASPSQKQAPGFSGDIPGLHSWLFLPYSW